MNREEILTTFGNNLKKIRLKRGLSQERLAELVNVDRTYIGMVERGKKSISLIYITRLLKVLQVSADDLFKGLNDE
ncbi:helix-turn-helix domain-containing protein [Limosilactobacillus mucosae]|uniref:Helix-turn-helix transcriptional regulator n=1 Tax=Limosilactobacillus mucosae TaxID=97478 RepID=A0A7L9VPK8_LIMMU|nr:helix-turn-helix transcriptional regulator [Limosilactobacillus mucosae]QOL69343.1 helix-turn-helix transcriptional regulator [Limosilactobacillus mucosae]